VASASGAAKPAAAGSAAPAGRPASAGPAARPPATASSETKPKGRFLLHLTSFNDRKQAEVFARRFAGANAYVAAAEVPGKGTVYRVRVGNYASFDEAAAAKTNFEREHNVIAYVAAGSAKP
jgi:cell division septation protein DedD